MPKPNITKMQEEFIKTMSESSTRFATAWSEAVKGTEAENIYENCEKLMLNCMDPSAFMRIVDSTSMGLKLRELITLAAQDLPELIKHAGDVQAIARIKEKWEASYEKLVRQAFGIPTLSDIERVLQPWRSLMESFTGAGASSWMPFNSMASSIGWPFPRTADSRDLFRQWSETYEKTIGKLFRLPGFGLTREYEERTKKALDAQIRFLNTLPDFQEQVLTASKAAIGKVVEHVTKMDIKQVTPETYQLFYKIWISINEDAFIELFRSETFCRTLANTVHRGLDAKKQMDTVMADGLSFWNLPSRRDMDEVYEAVYQMRKRIRALEHELDDLKRQFGQPRRAEVVL